MNFVFLSFLAEEEYNCSCVKACLESVLVYMEASSDCSLPVLPLQLDGAHGHGGYDSDFSDEESGEKSLQKTKSIQDDALLIKPFQKAKQGSVVHRQFAAEECDREEARKRRFHLISMDAYERHKKFVHDYILYYGGKIEDFRRSGANDKTDLDVIRENHRFLWNEEDEADMNWEKRLAKKYYDKLFKEYCIADLSRYKENKFGFRWRHEKEVISGKGQFSCGNKHCDENEGLKSWEIQITAVQKMVLQKLTFGKVLYEKQMKNHGKRSLRSIFKIYFSKTCN
ncbi:hypothetical protein IHE44_0001614 [Lamprotornis superbus]|uniref:Protein FRA10AC1 n=1 Tax=Lamprotornis superbus TaxID=245042 RepID=A0A835NS53_9PASS|nr:hypothetical protein IHE44_0001614 [Lamprotornis superbus]